jgi:hypothetical protein
MTLTFQFCKNRYLFLPRKKKFSICIQTPNLNQTKVKSLYGVDFLLVLQEQGKRAALSGLRIHGYVAVLPAHNLPCDCQSKPRAFYALFVAHPVKARKDFCIFGGGNSDACVRDINPRKRRALIQGYGYPACFGVFNSVV